jgi:hypothetical protein
MSTPSPPTTPASSASPVPTAQPQPFRVVQRGGSPAPSDFLNDIEMREKQVLELRSLQMTANAKARRLAIMQEHKERTEAANAITRDRR